MKHSKESLLGVIVLTIFFAAPSSGQNLHESGSEYLKARFPEKTNLTEDFKFNRELNYNDLIILESDNPPCFIVFLKSESEFHVAAYSTNNLLGIDSINKYPAMDLLKEIQNNPPKGGNFKKNMNTKNIRVGPLLKTQWDQGEWYNRFCPYHIASKDGEHVLAGCIAVAMGQIVRYYGKWNQFTIDETYICNTVGGQQLSASATAYNWASMLNSPANYDHEICRFLSDIGILVNMKYGPSMSSQSTGFARKALNKIGYVNASSIQKYKYGNEEWMSIFYSNLDNNNPILVAGTGHAFVCDGYNKEGMLHFNLGYGGPGNGFYAQGAVDGKYYVNEAIVNISPANDYISPCSLRREFAVGKDCISWSMPLTEQEIGKGYNVYYSDNDFFYTQDTTLRIESLRPGTHGIMISAKYNETESLWVGPEWVYNPGEKIATNDPEIIKSIAEQLEDEILFSDHLIIEEGKLVYIK